MDIKKSKIQHVEALPSWSNSYGTFYPHKVTFENGDVAITNKTKENAFSVGQELQYELVGEDPAGNNKFKEYRETSSQGQSPESNAGYALSYAKDIMCKFIELHNITDDKADAIANKTIKMAEKFNDWLNQH